MNRFEFLTCFGKCLLRGTGTVLCGAGVSKMSGLPLWDELLDPIRQQLGLPISFADLPLIAQYYTANVADGRQRLEDLITRGLSVSASPSIAHSLIAAMPLTRLWTTNYDRLLETAKPDTKVYARDIDLLDDPGEGQRVLYKMHGELRPGAKSLNNIIISREDYETYPRRFPRMWSQLTATFATQSILFLGFGFNDPNITHLLALARSAFQSGYRNHFAILRKPDSPEAISQHNYRMQDLQAVGINSIEIDDYGEITEILRQLLTKALPPTVFISGNFHNNEYDSFCISLGKLLGESGVSVISGAAQPGLLVSYALAEYLQEVGRYEPERVVFYYQSKNATPVAPLRRLGTIRYFGEDRSRMRHEMIRHSRVTILVSGDDGAREEAKMSMSDNVPVIPMACTGGAAAEVWNSLESRLHTVTFGGRPVDRANFEKLRSTNPDEALASAVALAKQAMFLDV